MTEQLLENPIAISNADKTSKAIVIEGLMLPKDTISRNGVMYAWDDLKKYGKGFEGVKIHYNHIIDSDEPTLGTLEKIWFKEQDDEEGKAGVYYKAKINPKSRYADSIVRGDLDKVSIQIQTTDVEDRRDKEGNIYQYAHLGPQSPLELSIVSVEGFPDTTMKVVGVEKMNTMIAFVEKFKCKESIDNSKFNSASKYIYGKDFGELGPGQQKKIEKMIKEYPLLEKLGEGDLEEDMTTSTNAGAMVDKMPKKESVYDDISNKLFKKKYSDLNNNEKDSVIDEYDKQFERGESLSEIIKHEGNSWNVYTKDGSKKLGSHPTKEEAEKQLAAIEANKHREGYNKKDLDTYSIGQLRQLMTDFYSDLSDSDIKAMQKIDMIDMLKDSALKKEMLSIGDFTYVNGKSTQVTDFAIEKDKNLVQYWGVDKDKKKVSWTGSYSESLKESKTKSFSYNELIEEHERLVDALKSKDPTKLEAELAEQSKELEEYKLSSSMEALTEDEAKEILKDIN